MNIFSIEDYISQQIMFSLKKTNNLFTKVYLKNIWETTVINQTYLKRPLAFIYYWKKRKQLLKKSKKTNQVFLFSVKTVMSAAQERWPLGLSPDHIYNSVFMSVPRNKRESKEEFYRVLKEKEENYQRAAILFFECLKNRFFCLVPKQSTLQLRRLFFDAALEVLQDPKMQKTAIKASGRKSKSHFLATHKIKDIKEIFYELAKRDTEIKRREEIDSFRDVA